MTVYSVVEEAYVVTARDKESAIASLRDEHHEPIYSENIGAVPEKQWAIEEFKGSVGLSRKLMYESSDWEPLFKCNLQPETETQS